MYIIFSNTYPYPMQFDICAYQPIGYMQHQLRIMSIQNAHYIIYQYC